MQERYFMQNPQLEQRYSAALLEQAHERVKEMIAHGDTMTSLPVGDQHESYFLSRRQEDVVGSQEIIVDEVKFFLGMKNEVSE